MKNPDPCQPQLQEKLLGRVSSHLIFVSSSVTSVCLVGVGLSIFNSWVGEEPTFVAFLLFFPAREKAVRFLGTTSGLSLLLQGDKAANWHFQLSQTSPTYFPFRLLPSLTATAARKFKIFTFHQWSAQPKVTAKQTKPETDCRLRIANSWPVVHGRLAHCTWLMPFFSLPHATVHWKPANVF